MAPPRLKGTSLSLVRALARNRSLGRVLFAQNAADFRMDEMLALPASAGTDIDVEPRPVQGAPPRRWDDGRHAPPVSTRTTGAALRAAYSAGATHPVAVLDRIVARIDDADFGLATHSPFVALALDEARRAAEQSAARWVAGKPLGPLDGVPVPVKDELDLAGLPTTGGTAYRTEPADTDSWVVRRLREAGAVIVGKTHTTEWGMNPWGMNPNYPMPRNAYSSEHGAGGSSTGTAAAVAMGLAPAGVGSDGGGSIRIPSSLNGLFGLKPTFIRVGRTGDIFDPSTTVAHLGPIGQSTDDLVELLAVIGGEPDPADPMTRYAPDGDPIEAWRAAIGRGVKGCRIGVPESEWADADAGVAALGRSALAALEEEGAVLVDVGLPNAALAGAAGALQIIVETYGGVMDDFAAHGEAMGMDLQLLLSLVEVVSARDYMKAQRVRARFRRTTAAAIAGVDVIALPTTKSTAPAYPLSETGQAISDTAAIQRVTRFVWLGNITGLPAGTAPVGMHDGLSVGLQIVGDAWDEASVIAVLAHVERLGLAALPAPPGWKPLLG